MRVVLLRNLTLRTARLTEGNDQPMLLCDGKSGAERRVGLGKGAGVWGLRTI